MKDDPKKVAIVCDWLLSGGSEKVILELHHMYPEASIYASYAAAGWQKQLDGKLVTGYLQHWPLSALRKYIPYLRMMWFSHLNLSAYDLVISSSGAEAKGVRVKRRSWIATILHRPAPKTTLVAYMYTPTHYYWSRYEQYLSNPGFGRLDPIARLGLKILLKPLRKWDYAAAQRPDYIIAISTHIQQQIKKYYDRDSTVIHPPVDTKRFQAPVLKHDLPNKRKGFVITGRQTPYKRIDLAVAACTQLNLPLVVIGNGPEHKKLKKLAGKSVTFLRNVTDAELPHYLQSAEAFLFPGIEDFGIAPVEAMASGTPVIAYRAGGALDYVIDGKTGVFFADQTVDSLVGAISKFQSLHFVRTDIVNQSERFSTKTFQSQLSNYVQSHQNPTK